MRIGLLDISATKALGTGKVSIASIVNRKSHLPPAEFGFFKAYVKMGKSRSVRLGE